MARMGYDRTSAHLEGGPFTDERSVTVDGAHVGYVARDGEAWVAFDKQGDRIGGHHTSRQKATEAVLGPRTKR